MLWTPPDPSLDIPALADGWVLDGVRGAAAKALQAGQAATPKPLDDYYEDVNGYWVDALHCRPWKGEGGVPGQYEINARLPHEPRVAIFAGTGIGKTFWAGNNIDWFVKTRRNAKVIVMATTWTQLLNQLFRHIRRAHMASKRNLGAPGECLQARLEIDVQWFVLGLSPRDPEGMAGYHPDADIPEEVLAQREKWLTMGNEEFFRQVREQGDAGELLLVFDESSGIADEFHDAGDGLLTTPKSRCWKLGNLTRTAGRFHTHWSDHPPRTPNRLWFPWEDAERGPPVGFDSPEPVEEGDDSRSKSWATYRWTSFDAPAGVTDAGWIEQMRRECGPNYEKNPRYMVRVLALPPEGSELAVFPPALLEATADLRPAGGGRHMAVDIGYGGGDPCVATLWVDGRASSIFTWQVEGPVLDAVDTARVIAYLAKGNPEVEGDRGWDVAPRNVHLDATDSGGKAVVDYLRRFHRMHVDGVDLGAGPVGDWNHVLGRPPRGLTSRRQELCWILLRCLQEGRVAIPNHRDFGPMISQLSQIHYHEDHADEFRVELKKRTIARIGRSPDDADTALLALSRVDPASLRIATVRRGRRAVRRR